MQVKVNVHESKVEQLRPGMRARIRILDRVMTGVVTSIANQPEPTGWFSANVKEYATLVRIDGQPEGLRPGMTAEVEILIAHLKKSLLLPVACVVEQGRQYFAWVVGPDGYEKRTLLLGASNDQFIAVTDGVTAGEVVLLNPRAVVADARTSVDESPEDTGASRFGEATGAGGGGPGRSGATGAAGGPGGGDGPSGSPSGPGSGSASERPGTGGPGGNAGPPSGGPGAEAGGGAPGSGGPPGAGGPPGGGRGTLMRFDTDGDGKISREEAPEQMKDRFDTLDANGDGFLDQSDFDAMRNRAQ
jgi:hypothetical protein